MSKRGIVSDETILAAKASAALKPVSVLLICDSYPPIVGGSEVEAQRVASAMIRRGHRVQVLCAGGPPMPPVREWVDPAGVPVRILTRHSRGRAKDFTFAAEVAWAIWRGRNEYDVVYFLMQGLHLAAGLPVARWAGKPIVMKVGGSGVIPESPPASSEPASAGPESVAPPESVPASEVPPPSNRLAVWRGAVAVCPFPPTPFYFDCSCDAAALTASARCFSPNIVHSLIAMS